MKKFIILLAMTGLITSCYDLDQFPHDQLNSGTFWKTEEHAHQGMVAMYSTLRLENGFGAFYDNDALSDIAGDYNNWLMPSVIKGTYSDRTGIVQNRWQTLYEGIFRANLLLQNIDNVNTTEEQKQIYKGEAYFIRALNYFYLSDYYGGVPLYDENTIVSNEYMNMKKQRSSIEETRNFIIEDLNKAIEVLPTKWPTEEYGRATSGAAIAFRGKVKLYAKDYEGAKKDFEELVFDKNNIGYGYKLHDNYSELFTLKADQSSEIIFSIQAINGINSEYGIAFPLRLGTRATYGSCWNNCIPTDILVDSYENKDGSKFDWSNYFPEFNNTDIVESRKIQDRTFAAELSDDKKSVAKYPISKDKIREAYENRDPRLEQTIITPYSKYYGCYNLEPKMMEYVLAVGVNEANGFIRDNLGHYNYYWRKFVPEGNMDGVLDDRSHSPIDFPLMRYADVLLMLAECYNELGNIDNAIEMINKVRQRPSTNMPPLNNGKPWLEARTKEEVFKRIINERAVELACEGHRFSDLRRWGIAKEKLNFEYDDIRGNVRYTRIFEDRDYLWPIPAVEFERNENLGVQNPGW